jgi:hypothetical protein
VTTKAKPSQIVGRDLVANEWPFEVRLLLISDLIADPKYQRPPQEAFIEKLVGMFDDTLVSTIDVSERADGTLAILDGLQRVETMRKLGRLTVWASVYDAMSLQDEARFFYRRNRDRRAVHAYYQFRARVLMGETQAQAIDKIARAENFRFDVNSSTDDRIGAVRAAEDAYSYSSLARSESLSAALRTIRASFYGRRQAKDAEILRGLGRFFQPFYDDEIDHEHLYSILAEVGPVNLIGRAKDSAPKTVTTSLRHGGLLAREVLTLYNRGRSKKLSQRILTLAGRPK